MTKKYGWSKNVLINQIENKNFEKFLLAQTNFDKELPEEIRHQAVLAVKDEYNWDFLEISAKHSERTLEEAIVNNIRNFLEEMGHQFAFIGNQYKIEIEGNEYFIDLLLYHRKLNCLIAIELKIGEFKPEYAGKMQFYLAALDKYEKQTKENPSIGIIICKSKQRTIVEFALQYSNSPIGVSTYNITPNLPKEYEKLLPSSNELSEKLEKLLQSIK